MRWLAYCAARLDGLAATIVLAARTGYGGVALDALRADPAMSCCTGAA